jgi:hypothetical protein
VQWLDFHHAASEQTGFVTKLSERYLPAETSDPTSAGSAIVSSS